MPRPWINLAILLAAAILVWRMGERWRFAAVIYLAALAPVSGIVPFGYQAYSTVADRYAYLPLIGIALILGDALVRLGATNWHRAFAGGFACVWIIVLAGVTFAQTAVWRNSLALWERVMECNPHPAAAAFANYGSAFFHAGRNEEALYALQKSVTVKPDYIRGRYNLARVLQAMGRTGEAGREYLTVLKADPGHVNAWVALGALRAEKGDFAGCAEASQRALRLDPRNSFAAMNLGLALLSLRKPAEAAQAFDRVLAVNPGDAEARRYLEAARRMQNEQRR